MYVYKHLALPLGLAFLQNIIWSTLHIIEDVHIVYEANVIALIHKHISLLYAAVDDMVVIHAPIVAPI